MSTSLALRFEVKHQVFAKGGLNTFECEDSVGIRSQARRFCVADGATEGFDPRRWARLLTKSWVGSERTMLTKEQLDSWLRETGTRFGSRWQKRSLPWYAEEKARSGAFAAFVGLTFLDAVDGWSWQAIAVGDSCLIQRRRESILCAFPINDPAQFGYHPVLLPSDVARQDSATAQLCVKNGDVEVGDVFLLLTDAIAAWYMRTFSSDHNLIETFESLVHQQETEALRKLIDIWRDDGSLRNDDVAVLRISIESHLTE